MYNNHCCIVSWVSAHGLLNIPREFGPHGHLSGTQIVYVCIEAATLVLTREWALAQDTTVYIQFVLY